MLLAAELARPSAVLGPVDCFAFCRFASIWACVDIAILIPDLKLKEGHKSTPPIEKIAAEVGASEP